MGSKVDQYNITTIVVTITVTITVVIGLYEYGAGTIYIYLVSLKAQKRFFYWYCFNMTDCWKLAKRLLNTPYHEWLQSRHAQNM